MMNLIYDMNNMAHVHFYGNKEAGEDEWLGLTFQSCLHDMKNIFNKLKPDRIVLAFDSYSWRKIYTDKEYSVCITHQRYKGGRDKNKTPKELKRKRQLDDELNNMREIFREITSHVVLYDKYLEADDLIAGFIQMHPDEDHIIVSSDKDYMQLIGENVKLYNPVEDDYRKLDDWEHDAKLYLFEKCFRGDSGDYIISSYPRLRKTKIFEAYRDDYVRNNLMNHQYKIDTIDEKTGELKTYEYTTRDVFEENVYLIDLTAQPDAIRELMTESIQKEIVKEKTFSMFRFLKFCGKYDLPIIIKNAESFIPLFNLKPRKASA